MRKSESADSRRVRTQSPVYGRAADVRLIASGQRASCTGQHIGMLSVPSAISGLSSVAIANSGPSELSQLRFSRQKRCADNEISNPRQCADFD